jgi:hypothetical protein
MIVGDPGSRGDTYEHLFVDEQSRDGYSEAGTFRRFDRGQARRNHSGQKKRQESPADRFVHSVHKDSAKNDLECTPRAGEAIERHHQV